jgi:hypothetical protein
VGNTASGGTSTATVNCPTDHPHAIGGGFQSNPDSVFVFFNDPIGGSSTSPATGWQASGNVNLGFTTTITVYVICST